MALTRRKKLILWWWWKKRNIIRRTRRFAVHPINKLRHIHGEYHHLMPQLLNDPERFAQYFRMKHQTFYDLLQHCAADLKEKSTNFCRAISPEERLVVTLRFLATGDSFRSLAFRFRLGASTVRVIIKKTVKVLFKKLQPLHLPPPDENMWTKTAEDFFQRWNFPLCLGAIDGKHVQLKAPFHCGSQYYNYKSHHSIVLLAIVDANGKFLVIDVGGFGSCSDGGIFQDSLFFKLLKTKKLNVPKPAKIPNTGIELPYMFVGDEAFALMPNLMRPFPRRFLSNEKHIFNYRLSRARRQVECTFGVLSSMWRIMRKPIEVEPNFAIDMVKAVCVLHNYINDKEPECRRELRVIQNDSDVPQWRGLQRDSCRAPNEAMTVRNALMSYFVSPKRSLPWQTDLFTNV